MKYKIYDDFVWGHIEHLRAKGYELLLFNSNKTLKKFVSENNTKLSDAFIEYNDKYTGNRKGVWVKFKQNSKR